MGAGYGLSFARSGQQAVAAFDGGIRLYGADLRPVARPKAPGGGHPYSVAFSADASVVAVGYGDTPNVDILSVRAGGAALGAIASGGDWRGALIEAAAGALVATSTTYASARMQQEANAVNC